MLISDWSHRRVSLESAGRQGDEPSVPATAEEIFHAYAPRVYHLARRMVEHDADAEDVTQEVLLQVIRKIDTFRGEAALTTWLNRVTVNSALLHRRKQARRRERQVNAPLHVLPDHEKACAAASDRQAPEQRLMDEETRELIENAIARLPERYRHVYVLADVENLPNAVVGVMLNLRVPAVKSRLHRARQMMREALTPHFEGENESPASSCVQGPHRRFRANLAADCRECAG